MTSGLSHWAPVCWAVMWPSHNLFSLTPTSFSQENDQKRDFLSHLKDEGTEVWRLKDTAQIPHLAHPSGTDGEVSSPSGKVTTG